MTGNLNRTLTDTSRHHRRVALFGPYASRNLGDTATQMSVMQNLRRRCPDVQFLGISPEPDDTLRSLGIPAFPLTGFGASAGDLGGEFHTSAHPDRGRAVSLRAIRKIAGFVRSLDLLVISGGGQIDDFWGGPWAHPWSMLLWTTIARWQGVPVVYLAIGLDKLNAALSRRFCIWALQLASARSFRDTQTHQAMLQLGLNKPSAVCPDVVFALEFSATRVATGSQPFVVISPISRKTWSSKETDTHTRYLQALIEAGLHLANQGFAIRIVCSQTVMDTADARHLARCLTEGGAVEVTLCDAPIVEDFLRHVSGAELVVASRLHAVILSLITGAPVVALAHLGKVGAAMKVVALDDFCLSLQDFPNDQLLTLIDRALSRREILRDQIRAANLRLRSELVPTFDTLASLLPPKCS
jgi:polysaccharide pyruvyl transferase WcaK-like protein